MSKFLLLADSNVANNLQHQAIIGRGQFDFKKCTTKGLFTDKILAAQAELVVIAGIDCIVSEALSSPRESERCVSFVLNSLVSKIVEKLEQDVSSAITVALASPLYWDAFSEEVKKSLQSAFKQVRKDWKHKIKFIPPCPGMNYLPDRIHLSELAGVRYTNHIIKKACSLAKIQPTVAANPSWADDVELEQMQEEDIDMDQEDTQVSTAPSISRNPSVNPSINLAANRTPQPSISMAPSFNQFNPPPVAHFPSMISNPYVQVSPFPSQGPTNHELLQKLEALTKRIDSVEDKAYYDNLTFAAIKEDQDDQANRNNLDRVTLTGVKIDNFNRTAENEKPASMKAAVNKIIELVTADGDKNNRTVVFTRHRNRHIRNAPTVVIEARFQDAKQATAFRKDFVATFKRLKAEEQLPPEMVGVSTYPVQTVGTRVRAALLRAMAVVVDEATGPHISAYCQQFNTRPILKIVTKGQGDHISYQTFGFVDAILKLKSNEDLHRVALNEAYQVAGSSLRGRLQQHFVILKDH